MPSILAVHPSLGVNNVPELIALAKAKPDQLFFGSVGVGSPPHLAGELFKVLADVKLTHVPYAGGSGQAATDLIAGRISMVFSPASTIAPHVDAGSVKALAAATAKRAGLFPDLPTIAEAGLPGLRFRHLGRADGAGRHAAPGDRPACPRGQRCAQDARGAVRCCATPASIRSAARPRISPSLIQAEVEKWAKVAKAAGLSK